MLTAVSMPLFMWGRRQGSVREVTGLHHPSPSAASYGPDLCGTAIKTGHRSIEQYSNCLFIFFFLSEFCFNVPSFIRTDWFTVKKLQYLFPTISFFFLISLWLDTSWSSHSNPLFNLPPWLSWSVTQEVLTANVVTSKGNERGLAFQCQLCGELFVYFISSTRRWTLCDAIFIPPILQTSRRSCQVNIISPSWDWKLLFSWGSGELYW